jgi:hypothetical protein
MAIPPLKIQISMRLRVYSCMRMHLSSRTPHDHRPRCRVHSGCPMGPACERIAALLLGLSRRNIAVAPASFAPVGPSRRAAIFVPGEKWIPMMIPVVIKVMVAQHPIAVTVTIPVAVPVTI